MEQLNYLADLLRKRSVLIIFALIVPIVLLAADAHRIPKNTVITGTLDVSGATTSSGVLSGPDGTVSAPGISFKDDLNNGLFRVGADNWQLVVGGNNAIDMKVSSGGYANVALGETTAGTSDSFPLYIKRDQATSTLMRIDNVSNSPSALTGLQVLGDGFSNYYGSYSGNNTNRSLAARAFIWNATGNGASIVAQASGSDIGFWVDGVANANEVMRIENYGVQISDDGAMDDPLATAVLELTSTSRAFYPPRMTTVQKEAISSPGAGAVVYDSTTNELNIYNGTAWGSAGGSGSSGGGGSLQWIEDVQAPLSTIDNFVRVYEWESENTANLYATLKVPNDYVAGTQIFLRGSFYTSATSGTVLMETVTTLIRAGTDAITSTTNQHTSTNSAVTVSASTVDEPQAVNWDLTDSSGQVNSISVSAGDILIVKLTRDTAADSAASSAFVPAYAMEVNF